MRIRRRLEFMRIDSVGSVELIFIYVFNVFG